MQHGYHSCDCERGRQVTVTIWKVSRTKWEVNLTDDTNHESYTIPPIAVRWPGILGGVGLEVTARCASGCSTGELASYGPDVVFSGLGRPVVRPHWTRTRWSKGA